MGRARKILMRGGIVLTAAMMMASVSATSAEAATGRAVTGPVVGSAPFDVASCSPIHQVYEGSITTPGGVVAQLDVDVCVAFDSTNCTATGTFSIVEGSGKVKGAATGTIDCFTTKRKVPFDFTLEVQKSTHHLAKVGQDLHFRGKWQSDMESGGPFTGKVSLT